MTDTFAPQSACETAPDALAVAAAEIAGLLARITTASNRFGADPEHATWADAAEAQIVAVRLRSLAALLHA